MFSKLLTTATVALAASGLATAQTHSLCNPVKGQSKLTAPSSVVCGG